MQITIDSTVSTITPLAAAADKLTNLYQQSTGRFTDPTGRLIGVGYSGRGSGLNNPQLQMVPTKGPIPQGLYKIGPAETHPKLGPMVMAITPYGEQELFGRAGFFIHGDNQGMNYTASEGCIILSHEARAALAASENKRLRVIA